jgi:hypothetical protein
MHLLAAFNPECSMNLLEQYWLPVNSTLQSIHSTHSLGTPVPTAFSPKIQRKLASTVPPRPIVELEFKDAYDKWKQLSIDCEEAAKFAYLDPDPLQYQVRNILTHDELV